MRRVAIGGGTPKDVAVEQSDPIYLVVGASGIYFTNGSASSHACKTLVKVGLP